MILTDRDSSIEINLIDLEHDANLSSIVSSKGFSGSASVYVQENEFIQFCVNLCTLQKTLKGKAELKSMSPGELDITIQPYNSLGHLSVIGSIGRHIYTSQSMHWHSIEFGFEIEPQELDKAIKEKWVIKYGT